MLLTQGVPYIDREQLGLSYISCPSLLRFRGPRHDNINLYISLYIVDHYLNIGLFELWSIVCQIHIEKESDVWFGRYSQWLAQLADLPRQPFGLVFSLHSMQTSWGVLGNSRYSLEYGMMKMLLKPVCLDLLCLWRRQGPTSRRCERQSRTRLNMIHTCR